MSLLQSKRGSKNSTAWFAQALALMDKAFRAG
jgi:hypothetical protein